MSATSAFFPVGLAWTPVISSSSASAEKTARVKSGRMAKWSRCFVVIGTVVTVGRSARGRTAALRLGLLLVSWSLISWNLHLGECGLGLLDLLEEMGMVISKDRQKAAVR